MMHDGDPGLDPRDDEALWRLLERAPQPKPVSPYFARRVLREVAALEDARPAPAGWRGWLARLRQAGRQPGYAAFAGAFAAVALLVAGGAGMIRPRAQTPAAVAPVVVAVTPVPASVPESEAVDPIVAEAADMPDNASDASADATPEPVVTAQDVEVIADLDNLLSKEESRLWTEDTARF